LGARTLLLSLSQPQTALLLGLLFRLVVLIHLSPAQSCLPVLLDALCLALVVCLCFGISLGLGLGGLLRLLAFDLGVLGGVP
jgi:hypothetical protein